MNHSYFREWLNQLRGNLYLVDRLPETADYEALEALDLRMGSHSGGIFENLGVSGEMTSLVSIARHPIYFTSEDATVRLPTILFGLPAVDKEMLKRELVQYIIEADKKAQKLSVWSKAAADRLRGHGAIRNSFKVYGDDNLFKLIVGLTYVPSVANYAVPNFSEAEYLRTVVEILQQLIEIADTSLVNVGTYVSVLEAASSIVKDVERQYGLNSRKQAGLARATVLLQRTMHHRLLKGLKWMSHGEGNAKACTMFLSPNLFSNM
ncbi:MAG: hypothetical protein IPK68_14090 [Bdellovibrionales bacterium]|nr:hypothetical protein [Bdellovibrionales bacterium]